MTALVIASSLGHTFFVELLLQHPYIEIDDNNNEYGWTALHCAADKGHTDCLSVLLADGMVNVNRLTKSGETALMLACQYGHTAAARVLLLDRRTDPNIVCKGWTALHHAIDNGYLQTMEVFIGLPDVDINKQTEVRTPSSVALLLL